MPSSASRIALPVMFGGKFSGKTKKKKKKTIFFFSVRLHKLLLNYNVIQIHIRKENEQKSCHCKIYINLMVAYMLR